MFSTRFLAIALALVPSLPAVPRISYGEAVCRVGGGQPFETIQKALDARDPGGAPACAWVLVDPGNYHEQLAIDHDVRIVALPATVVIDGGGTGTTVTIAAGATVLLRGVTVTGGNGVHGGGILNHGQLALAQVVVTENSAEQGGGIWSDGGLHVGDSAITANSVTDHGGGLFVPADGTLEITGSVIGMNESQFQGGGLYAGGGYVRISDSRIEQNRAAQKGGGWYQNGSQIEFQNLGERVVISGNSAEHGGGLYVWETLTLRDSEILRNSATSTSAGGAVVSGGDLTLERVTVADNETPPSGDGGGIYNLVSRLTLRDVVFRQNRARNGAAVLAYDHATTVIERALFAGNAATDDGAGIYHEDGGQLTIADAEFVDNVAHGGGGALFASNDVALVVRDTHIANNFAGEGGGGIQVLDGGETTIEGCTVRDNWSAGLYAPGGGLDIVGGTATIVDSLIATNQADLYGGGLSVEGAALYLLSSTVAGNRSPVHGGGVAVRGPDAVAVVNSTISDNTAPTGAALHLESMAVDPALLLHVTVVDNDATLSSGAALGGIDLRHDDLELAATVVANGATRNCSRRFVTRGANVESADSCGLLPEQGDQPDTDPGLGPLGDNGGPTPTHAPLGPDSAVVDAAPCVLEVDQRGQPRPSGVRCDGGSVELLQQPK